MSLHIPPPISHPSTTNKQTLSAPSAPGLPDSLRSGLGFHSQTTSSTLSPHTLVSPPFSTHPLESRLLQWRSTQHTLKMEGLRRTFGIAEPVRRGMELGMVRAGEWRAGTLGGSAGVAGDILEGRDWSCEWEDIFVDDENKETVNFHSEMERRLKMN